MSLCAGCSKVEVHRYPMCLKCRVLASEIEKRVAEMEKFIQPKLCTRCKKGPPAENRKSCVSCLLYFDSHHVHKTARRKWRQPQVIVEKFLSSSYR